MLASVKPELEAYIAEGIKDYYPAERIGYEAAK
jgi:hypothetical protein